MDHKERLVTVGRLLNVPVTCWCISGKDLFGTWCYTEIIAGGQTFYLTKLQYTKIGQTSPRAHPETPGAWQGGHWGTSRDVRRLAGWPLGYIPRSQAPGRVSTGVHPETPGALQGVHWGTSRDARRLAGCPLGYKFVSY